MPYYRSGDQARFLKSPESHAFQLRVFPYIFLQRASERYIYNGKSLHWSNIGSSGTGVERTCPVTQADYT